MYIYVMRLMDMKQLYIGYTKESPTSQPPPPWITLVHVRKYIIQNLMLPIPQQHSYVL